METIGEKGYARKSEKVKVKLSGVTQHYFTEYDIMAELPGRGQTMW